jgi:hypothetical protein
LTPETDGSGGTEAGSAGESAPLVQKGEATAQAPEAEVPTQAGPQQAGGRRTQLRIVRENIQSLSEDVGSFRKSQEASNRKLAKQVVLLWEESSKSIGFRKSHEASSRKLEKQVVSLRKELAALKSQITEEAAKSRRRQDAALSKVLAKVSAKPSKPAKRSKPARRSKK